MINNNRKLLELDTFELETAALEIEDGGGAPRSIDGTGVIGGDAIGIGVARGNGRVGVGRRVYSKSGDEGSVDSTVGAFFDFITDFVDIVVAPAKSEA